VPEQVLCSTAERTQQTWALMADEFPDARFGLVPSFYLGGPSDVAAELARLDDGVACALVLGHNPGWDDVVEALSGRHVGMTTANAALLEGPGGRWRDLAAAGAWRLVDVLRPKELDD